MLEVNVKSEADVMQKLQTSLHDTGKSLGFVNYKGSFMCGEYHESLKRVSEYSSRTHMYIVMQKLPSSLEGVIAASNFEAFSSLLYQTLFSVAVA